MVSADPSSSPARCCRTPACACSAPQPAEAVPAPVHMMADGIALHGMVDDNSAVFMVPSGTRDLRLVSPSFLAQAPDVRTPWRRRWIADDRGVRSAY